MIGILKPILGKKSFEPTCEDMRFRNRKWLQVISVIKFLHQQKALPPIPLKLTPKVSYKLLEKEGYFWDKSYSIWQHDDIPF